MRIATPPPAARHQRLRVTAAWCARRVQQFNKGQSNPTYLLTAPDGTRWVLRKKPPGHLLRGAHQIEREYRVINALQDTRVPVPRTLCLCEDESVIGTPFYMMEFMNGRVFDYAELQELPPAERAQVILPLPPPPSNPASRALLTLEPYS